MMNKSYQLYKICFPKKGLPCNTVPFTESIMTCLPSVIWTINMDSKPEVCLSNWTSTLKRKTFLVIFFFLIKLMKLTILTLIKEFR